MLASGVSNLISITVYFKDYTACLAHFMPEWFTSQPPGRLQWRSMNLIIWPEGVAVVCMQRLSADLWFPHHTGWFSFMVLSVWCGFCTYLWLRTWVCSEECNFLTCSIFFSSLTTTVTFLQIFPECVFCSRGICNIVASHSTLSLPSHFLSYVYYPFL